MSLAEISETDECLPWYEHSQAVSLTAEFLASQGADPWTIVSVYESPWLHTLDYHAALAAGVEYLAGE